MTTATADTKELGRRITQEENKLEAVKAEVEKNEKARDALLAEIEKRTGDFTIYMAQKDAESKKLRADTVTERDQLVKDTAEFQEILKKHHEEKIALEAQKRELDIQRLKDQNAKQNVQDFITAVRRAVNLLGI